MSIIKSFKGYRPVPNLAKQIASRPYDVLNRAEAKAEATDNPYSYLHIVRSEIGLPDEVSAYDATVYAKAKANFEQMTQENILVQDTEASMYVYAQTMNGKQQVGLVACTSIDDCLNDIIKKHEFTRPTKEQDRINHIYTTNLHSGPILMAYPNVMAIDAIINQVIAQKPAYDFAAVDDIQHTFWVIDDADKIGALTELFAQKVPYIYIADGHHRVASSTKVGLRKRAENEHHTGEEEYNYFLSVLFPDNQLTIIDYNRVVTDLNGLSKADFLAKVSEKFDVEISETAYQPQTPYRFGMYLDKKWYMLTAKKGTYEENHPILSLDISVLSDNLLAPILNITDQRTDNRIDFVGGIRGMKELERRVDSGEMCLAFSIYAVSIQQLIDVANSGKVMPPKSTWFEPKLRSGLVTHQF
ncbi:MAG: DUF1015 domain-containing protein [Chitinophagales bacterium]